MENEKFAPLKMAGVEGQVTAVLTDENLLLERADRKGMRIDLESITRIRHHHVAFTPPLLTLFGVLSVLASFRVFTGSIQIYSFILGVTSLLVWLLGRRPALCIDTKQGDRHLLHGRDHILHRMYTILDRMSDGCTLEDAVIGLEELQQPELPLLGDIEDIRHEVGSVDAAQADLQMLGAEDESLEQALANLRAGQSVISSAVEPTTISEDSPAINPHSPPVPSATAVSIPEPGQTGMFERSTRALAEQRVDSQPVSTSYDVPFQLPDFSDQVSVSSVAPTTEQQSAYGEPTNRAQTAALEASQANFDTGGLFDMFDELDNVNAASNPPASTNAYPPPSSNLPAVTSPNWNRPSESNASSYTMLSDAAGPNLPEPTRVALRADIPSAPGLVASASTKIVEPEVSVPLPEQLQRSFKQITTPNPLESYPALNRMQKQYARDSRLRVNSSYSRSRGAWKAIGQWVKPGLKRVQQGGKEITRKIIGAGDGYHAVYGDEDGNPGDEYQDTDLQSTQILRLRADQDSQSDVQARLRLLTMNGGGAIADDLANRTLRGISSSSRNEGFTLAGTETKKLVAPVNFNGMVSSDEPAPRFAGMQRLG